MLKTVVERIVFAYKILAALTQVMATRSTVTRSGTSESSTLRTTGNRHGPRLAACPPCLSSTCHELG
jgi:hypothetical protein